MCIVLQRYTHSSICSAGRLARFIQDRICFLSLLLFLALCSTHLVYYIFMIGVLLGHIKHWTRIQESLSRIESFFDRASPGNSNVDGSNASVSAEDPCKLLELTSRPRRQPSGYRINHSTRERSARLPSTNNGKTLCLVTPSWKPPLALLPTQTHRPDMRPG